MRTLLLQLAASTLAVTSLTSPADAQPQHHGHHPGTGKEAGSKKAGSASGGWLIRMSAVSAWWRGSEPGSSPYALKMLTLPAASNAITSNFWAGRPGTSMPGEPIGMPGTAMPLIFGRLASNRLTASSGTWPSIT